MGLEEIKGIGPATVKKLNAAGIRTLDDLRGVDVERVAKRAKLDPLRLKEWQREAVGLKILDDVKGIGPAAKRKLKQAGIGDLDALARASIHEVAHATRIAEERLRLWQQQAQELLKQTQTTGKRVARATKERAEGAVREGRRAATTAKKRGGEIAQEAAERGRLVADAARRRAGAIRRPATNGADPARTVEEPTVVAAPSVAETPATNGHVGFLDRLRRVFQRQA